MVAAEAVVPEVVAEVAVALRGAVGVAEVEVAPLALRLTGVPHMDTEATVMVEV